MSENWRIESGIAYLNKEANSKKAFREGLQLMKKDDILLSIQVEKKKLLEIFDLNKEIGCYFCSINTHYKIMEIMTEDSMMKYIEQGIEYLNKTEDI